MNRCPNCSTETKRVYHLEGSCAPARSEKMGLSFVRKRSVGKDLLGPNGKSIGKILDYTPTGSWIPVGDQ
jgi:hypothetical protein